MASNKFVDSEGNEFITEFPPIRVKDLKAILAQFPNDALVFVADHSEYFALLQSDFRLQSGVTSNEGEDFGEPVVLITTRD